MAAHVVKSFSSGAGGGLAWALGGAARYVLAYALMPNYCQETLLVRTGTVLLEGWTPGLLWVGQRVLVFFKSRGTLI